MKKSELKDIIRPIVKECIHEVLLQEGILSSVISEVLAGLNPGLLREETVKTEPNKEALIKEELSETRKKMLKAVGKNAYKGVNVFENTTPLASAGKPNQSPTPNNPLSNVDPRDPGIDINRIFGGEMTSNWNKIAKGMK